MPAKEIEKLTADEIDSVVEQVQKIAGELLATQAIMRARKMKEIYSFQVPTMRRALDLLRRFSLELEKSRHAILRGLPYSAKTTTKNRQDQ